MTAYSAALHRIFLLCIIPPAPREEVRMKNIFNTLASKFRSQMDKWAAPKGRDILQDGAANKSTAFTKKERRDLGLRGLLPHAVETPEKQRERALEQLRSKTSNIEKYIYLSGLQESHERLFYDIAIRHTEEIMPLIYTPTVGQACKEFSHIFQNPRGLYITPDDKGKIRELLDNWQENDVRVIVITDGQRILGLGDLGANGMGIPIGKMALYTACGGISPAQSLPVMFDVGTNNEALLNDPLYLGYPHKRLTGKEYDALMAEFVAAVKDKYPKVLIQFEDFRMDNAYKLLETYRDKTTCFNDDIQGTAAVVLAGIYASDKLTGQDLKDQRIMFLGAGSAATGIADLIVKALTEEGLSEEEARQRLWMVDSEGLITTSRKALKENKNLFAQDHAPMGLLDAIKDIKPTILIGATGAPQTFTKEVIETMAAQNDHPVIFALSNPTDHAECTAQQAYEWSGGKAIFASGSPFAPVTFNGETFTPGQANNAYIFPGLGLGVVLSEATKVTDEMFLAAAKALADMVTEKDLKSGTLYPPLQNIRKVSAKIAEAVMKTAAEQNLAGTAAPPDIAAFIEKRMYDPAYDAVPSRRLPKQKTPKP